MNTTMTKPSTNNKPSVLVNISIVIEKIIQACRLHQIVFKQVKDNQLILTKGFFSLSVSIYEDTGRISVYLFRKDNELKIKIANFLNYFDLLKVLPHYFPEENFISALEVKDIKIENIREIVQDHKTYLKYVFLETNEGSFLICLEDLHESPRGNLSFEFRGKQYTYLINPSIFKSKYIRKFMITIEEFKSIKIR